MINLLFCTVLPPGASKEFYSGMKFLIFSKLFILDTDGRQSDSLNSLITKSSSTPNQSPYYINPVYRNLVFNLDC